MSTATILILVIQMIEYNIIQTPGNRGLFSDTTMSWTSMAKCGTRLVTASKYGTIMIVNNGTQEQLDYVILFCQSRLIDFEII